MENCPLRSKSSLTPHQHFDLLISKLGMDCGVRLADFHLHVGISQNALINLSEQRRVALEKRHGPSVTLYKPLGTTTAAMKGSQVRDLKDDEHGQDCFLLDAMEKYLMSRARPGDVLFLIAGAHAVAVLLYVVYVKWTEHTVDYGPDEVCVHAHVWLARHEALSLMI